MSRKSTSHGDLGAVATISRAQRDRHPQLREWQKNQGAKKSPHEIATCKSQGLIFCPRFFCQSVVNPEKGLSPRMARRSHGYGAMRTRKSRFNSFLSVGPPCHPWGLPVYLDHTFAANKKAHSKTGGGTE